VREFDAVMSNPFAPVTEVWVRARAVHWAYNFAMAPRRWEKESYRAARVASEIKRQTGNRILLWVLFPELGP
jgi:carbonic anhydrase